MLKSCFIKFFEMSQDSGNTWTQVGNPLLITVQTQKYTANFELDIKGPVRFRIKKDATNSRVMIDEINIKQN